jgi:hypothetical protein
MVARSWCGQPPFRTLLVRNHGYAAKTHDATRHSSQKGTARIPAQTDALIASWPTV